METSHDFLLGGLACLFTGQLLWFVAGGTYNALGCLARGQSPLSWLRQITWVHFHALLPPVRLRGRIPPAELRRRYPSAPWWYHAAVLGMAVEMIGLFVALAALMLEVLARLGQPGPVWTFSGFAARVVVATGSQVCSLA